MAGKPRKPGSYFKKIFSLWPQFPRMETGMETKQGLLSRALFEDVCGRQGSSCKDRGRLATRRDRFDGDHHGARSLGGGLWAPGISFVLIPDTLGPAGRGARERCQGEEPVGRAWGTEAAAGQQPFHTTSQRFFFFLLKR